MDKHLTFIAILNIALGMLSFIIGLGLFVVIAGSGMISGDTKAFFITGIVGSALGIFFTVLAVPGIIGGIGLLKRKGWARILMLITAVISLLHIPFGTIIGIYTIFVLLDDRTVMLFDTM